MELRSHGSYGHLIQSPQRYCSIRDRCDRGQPLSDSLPQASLHDKALMSHDGFLPPRSKGHATRATTLSHHLNNVSPRDG